MSKVKVETFDNEAGMQMAKVTLNGEGIEGVIEAKILLTPESHKLQLTIVGFDVDLDFGKDEVEVSSDLPQAGGCCGGGCSE
jgi:hypothetical protein